MKVGTGYCHIMSPISCEFWQNQRRQIRTLFNVVNEVTPPPPIFYIYYPIWAQYLTRVHYIMLSSVCELRKNRRKNSVLFFFCGHMRLHFRVYCGTVRHFSGKERPGKVYVLRYNFFNHVTAWDAETFFLLQSCYCVRCWDILPSSIMLLREMLRHSSFHERCNLTFWHRSFTFNSNKSPTWCNNFSVYYPDVCLQLNMFRAFSRPSSGAQWL